MKILFLVKGTSSYGYGGAKSGLIESATLTASQIHKHFKIETKVAICVDGNSIDAEVDKFKPTICVLEALWATPCKLKELTKLHPGVKFIVRVHSEIPFLATEGIAIEWIKEFVKIKNVFVSFNSFTTNEDFVHLLKEPVIYLPNIFNKIKVHSISLLENMENFIEGHCKKDIVNIGCFGAIRPMKNQLLQAVSAIRYGDLNNKNIHFHVNSGRQEEGGESIIKNIRSLFRGTKHTLVEHGWLDRREFLDLVYSMDIGMQVSFTESFNIVTADFVLQGVPSVVSEAITWMPDVLKTKNKIHDIADRLRYVLRFSEHYSQLQKHALNDYNIKALAAWQDFINLK